MASSLKPKKVLVIGSGPIVIGQASPVMLSGPKANEASLRSRGDDGETLRSAQGDSRAQGDSGAPGGHGGDAIGT